jgi:hypothetical protein
MRACTSSDYMNELGPHYRTKTLEQLIAVGAEVEHAPQGARKCTRSHSGLHQGTHARKMIEELVAASGLEPLTYGL